MVTGNWTTGTGCNLQAAVTCLSTDLSAPDQTREMPYSRYFLNDTPVIVLPTVPLSPDYSGP